MTEFKYGDRVSATGFGSGASYVGKYLRRGGNTNTHRIEIVSNADYPGKGQRPGTEADVINVLLMGSEPKNTDEPKRLHPTVMGVKPEPVQEPTHVGPFRADDEVVRDANGNRVADANSSMGWIDVDEKIAEVIAAALNHYYGIEA